MLRFADRRRDRLFAGILLLAAEISANLLCLAAAAVPPESVVYPFSGNRVGFPTAGLIVDANGDLYGTASGAAPFGPAGCFASGVGCGAVFMLTPPGPGGSGWRATFLHRFKGGEDGSIPEAGLIMDANGALYGTTSLGGGVASCYDGCGTVFRMTPPKPGETQWSEEILYRFKGDADGASPHAGVIMDATGALYGTTQSGGIKCFGKLTESCGTVFMLAPPKAGDRQWTERVLYRFKGGADGANPEAGLTIDTNDVLYGTTYSGGVRCFGKFREDTCGTVFALKPPPAGSDGWTETVLNRFKLPAEGAHPGAGLIMDASGVLYGTTNWGGRGCLNTGCGTVFGLSPPAPGTSGWAETVLYPFRGGDDGESPLAGLIMDASGALYGTTSSGGAAQWGTVFKLTPPAAGTSDWSERVLYSFTVGVDGYYPLGSLAMDKMGTLYGTTNRGGGGGCLKGFGCGTVFELVP
jgi:uncharacterized repeat protein (TIGR03803 family)